ncbi:luciferase family protein [Streptomyces echinoruber]|uniref:Luciferase domain-containing protein n=1 Tax=Streptomyces echinoruber TaxID=68898 RepID=A0A918RM03_9ACTN|nr:luciferase family protein [Streptomyces echinoruber]GHA04263.1 hypothetical protein GCM10010389_49740 [Streptomyces echinoruber]
MTLALRALAHLSTWPDLTETAPSCGTGRALASAHGEIAHFHTDRDVDLHLTRSAIRRLHRDLKASAAVRVVPGSPWVTIRLEAVSDVDLLVTLVSVALNSRQTDADTPDGTAPAGCNDGRGVGFVRADLGGADLGSR